jgi:hypothetical protein
MADTVSLEAVSIMAAVAAPYVTRVHRESNRRRIRVGEHPVHIKDEMYPASEYGLMLSVMGL